MLTLLEKPPSERADLSDAARETVLATVIGGPPQSRRVGPAGAASALRARLDAITVLTPGERLLMSELLARIARVCWGPVGSTYSFDTRSTARRERANQRGR